MKKLYELSIRKYDKHFEQIMSHFLTQIDCSKNILIYYYPKKLI